MAKGFVKGQSGNPAGRPQKAINKISRPLKMRISDFLETHFSDIETLWLKLPPKEKARLFTDLLPYVVPRMSNIDLDMNFDKLSEEDLNRIVDRLLNANRDEKQD